MADTLVPQLPLAEAFDAAYLEQWGILPLSVTEGHVRVAAAGYRRVGVGVFALYFTVQLLLPLRHHLYPGSVDWHEEGYRMSWRMMLRAKSGRAEFRVRDPETGETWLIDPRTVLSEHQASRLVGRPDMIWLFARHLHDDFARRGHRGVEVFVDSRVSLNGRPRAALIDPTVDLAAVRWRFLTYNGFVTPAPDDGRVEPERRVRSRAAHD